MGIVGERLSSACVFFAKGDFLGLKALSEELSVDALIHDDKLLAEASVACYALGKLSEKRYVSQSQEWPLLKRKLAVLLQKASATEEHKAIHALIGQVEALNKSFGRFVMGVIEKARLKAAANIYGHGASLGKAIELTGANKIEASSYIGMTRMPDRYQTLPLKERLSNARRMVA